MTQVEFSLKNCTRDFLCAKVVSDFTIGAAKRSRIIALSLFHRNITNALAFQPIDRSLDADDGTTCTDPILEFAYSSSVDGLKSTIPQNDHIVATQI